MNIQIMLNPRQYGYEECTHCNGYGSSLKEEGRTCSRCGGSGLIRSTSDAPTTPSAPSPNPSCSSLPCP
jgi:DnaJ-class molecular chaperone